MIDWKVCPLCGLENDTSLYSCAYCDYELPKPMTCVICGKGLTKLERGDICSNMKCIRKYFSSGHGSISSPEYKTMMDDNLKRLKND